ncbi:MAG: hypothetical protein JOZ81_34860, partial [Chloroflexi bacterium]|nr:hypothetical protein [Chloroflexota bacterium]
MTTAARLSEAPRSLADLTADLPPEAKEAELFSELERDVAAGPRPLIAIDDDPTGVQTVHDTPVLLTWAEPELQTELSNPNESVFFILTNSRSMPTPEAEEVNVEIGSRLRKAGTRPFVVASRSDSTLRGHFPAEPLALQRGLELEVDGYLLVPAFFEGGRYTIDDTHWVATPDASSGQVVPASATSFARDAVFGYHSAHLPAWVEEKSAGRWSASDVRSVSLATVRDGPEAVARALEEVEGGVPVVVNVAGYGDLTVFVLGLLDAEHRGKRFLYRTAASFVRVRAGQRPRPLLTAADIYSGAGARTGADSGGLVVVGSYQPSSSQQLASLLEDQSLRSHAFEIAVADVLGGRWSCDDLAQHVDRALQAGELAVVHTSRELVTGSDNLAIGRQITDALIQTVQALRTPPRFVIGKGGITSHEVAYRGLGALRAMVLGQLQPGVPVWRLEAGLNLRHGDIPYVVFPGNVGGPTSLL